MKMTMDNIRAEIERRAEDGGRFQLTFSKTHGTKVPDHIEPMGDLNGEHLYRLNFSYFFRPNDLVIDDRGVSQTLSFGGGLKPVFVPYEAVVMIADDWHERELVEAPTPQGPKLRLVTNDD